jgi:hypothetical protein
MTNSGTKSRRARNFGGGTGRSLPLRPSRGGFVRPFGCGWFIKQFLSGNAVYGLPYIDPSVGAPQADIFHHYKEAILKATALDRATRQEERQAKREKRLISPENIERFSNSYLARLPYKSSSCRYHSFVVYFSNLQRLGWVEPSGREEHSAFQDHYSSGQPRRYYRLTAEGIAASDLAWANPLATLYG